KMTRSIAVLTLTLARSSMVLDMALFLNTQGCVNTDRLAIDVAIFDHVAGEFSEFRRIAKALRELNLLAVRGDGLRREIVEEVRIHQAGSDGVCPHFLRGQIAGQRQCQGNDRAFAGGISRAARSTVEGADRGD